MQAIFKTLALTCYAFLASSAISQTSPTLRSVCGPHDDSLYVNNLRPNLGVPARLIWMRKAAVGAMATSAVAGVRGKFCSGTLIARDLFLTAAHCVDNINTKTVVSMNYEYNPGLQGLVNEEFFKITEVVENGFEIPEHLDYAILRLAGNPGDKYGITPVSAYSLGAGLQVTLIQHPEGLPKKVHGGSIKTVDSKYIYYANLDTEGGSSGSGLLDGDGNLVGVHVHGGCNLQSGNSATSLSTISRVSNTIKSLLP